MSNDIFTSDYKLTPYWWDETPRPVFENFALPAGADVVIIGAGYTGVSAALELTRAGRDVVVIDAEDAGWGCSSRNGGMISTSIKPSFEQLARRHGERSALNILAEGHASLSWIKDFVASEKIDCDFRVSGKFLAAHNSASFEKAASLLSHQPKGLEVKGHVVPRSEQHREIGTDAYYGGVVFEDHASTDPAKLHQGLLERAISAGAYVLPNCLVLGIENQANEHLITTVKGTIRARDVIVATNGYTKSASPWHRRRVIPIGSYMIATEPLPCALMDRLMPTHRTIGDTRRVIYYYRPSEDRSRIIFGGRVTGGETNTLQSGPLLYRDLVQLFPDLVGYKVSHTWMGFVGYTFDDLAHVGKHQGIYYALGYCGSGVAMSNYLGTKVAQQLLGKNEGKTAFDGLSFQTRPLYTGNPWFLSASVEYFRMRDRLNL